MKNKLKINSMDIEIKILVTKLKNHCNSDEYECRAWIEPSDRWGVPAIKIRFDDDSYLFPIAELEKAITLIKLMTNS